MTSAAIGDLAWGPLDHGDVPYEPTEECIRPLAPPPPCDPLGPRMLADLIRHPRSSARAIAFRLAADPASVSRTLTRLRLAGLVRRSGAKCQARWTLTARGART